MHERTATASYGISGLIIWLATLDWSTISMVVGIILGIGTFFINWHYKRANSKAFRDAIAKGRLINDPSE